MAFGLAAYVSRLGYPSPRKAGFQALVRLSWAGFHPQGSDKRFQFTSVRNPPFPNFLAQWPRQSSAALQPAAAGPPEQARPGAFSAVSANGKVVIADGYHRLCAVYSYDGDSVIPCKIV